MAEDSAFILAAINGHENAALRFLENGDRSIAQIKSERNEALALACIHGRTEVVKLLLQFGANVEHQAKNSLTPLMEAANGGFVDVGQLLLKAEADLEATVSLSGDTALIIAAEKGHAPFVELLILASAQIEHKNKKKCSALWLACSGGYLQTVKLLVKHKANTDSMDKQNVTPLIVAFRKGHVKIVKYLVNHVTQFPSELECARYITTLIDPDLKGKCQQCIVFIMEALLKQAEKSRKRSKQRRKKKKKAKKNAKKQLHNNDENYENGKDVPDEEDGKDEEEEKALILMTLAEKDEKFELIDEEREKTLNNEEVGQRVPLLNISSTPTLKDPVNKAKILNPILSLANLAQSHRQRPSGVESGRTTAFANNLDDTLKPLPPIPKLKLFKNEKGDLCRYEKQ